MLAGLWAGLWRLGWELPHGGDLAELHGPLMICGIFGTLIGLERAVALGQGWAFVSPSLSALATLALLGGIPATLAGWAYAASAASLTAVSAVAMWLQPALFTATLVLAAAAWLAGCLIWAGGAPIPNLSGWWLAFLILTIAGERLELSRFLPRRRGSLPLYLLATILVVGGAALGLTDPWGARLMGLGLAGLTLWLARHDIATRGIRGDGQVRFMAACMLAGYVWLGITAALLLAVPPGEAALGYDATLHAVLIGFVLSMVFGHALIILPALARIRIRYSPRLYGPLAILHASVALRVGADGFAWIEGRRWSGILTLLALTVFVATLALGRAAERHQA